MKAKNSTEISFIDFIKLCDERMMKYYGIDCSDHLGILSIHQEADLTIKQAVYEATEWIADKYGLQSIIY